MKFWIASLAIKICGVEILYWSAPLKWEAHMSKGKPMTADIVAQGLLIEALHVLEENNIALPLVKEIDEFFELIEA